MNIYFGSFKGTLVVQLTSTFIHKCLIKTRVYWTLKLTHGLHVPGTFHGMGIVDEDLSRCRQPTEGRLPLSVTPDESNIKTNIPCIQNHSMFKLIHGMHTKSDTGSHTCSRNPY